MRIELYISGQLFRTWEFEQVEYYDPLCEVTHQERKMLWDQVIENCKKEVELVISANSYEFFVILPARLQPAEIRPEEQEQFINQLIDLKIGI